MKRAPHMYSEHCAGCQPDTVHDDIGKIFLPGKFSAPRLDPRFHLFREKAMRPLLQAYHDHKRYITIAARAGQGKSILAAQFIHHIGAPFVWIQIGPEDRSRTLFAQTLTAAFAQKFVELKQTRVCHLVVNGQMDGESAEHEVPLLIDALRPYIGNQFYCILDDLHWIFEANASKVFLDTLLRKAPRAMRFILISRTPVILPSLSTRDVQIGNTDLALSRSEVATFLAEKLHISLSAEVVVDLHERTEGWLMGLLIAGHALANHHLDLKSIPLERISGGRPDQMFTYFHAEIESTLPPEHWQVVLMLSLLDQIPLELVQSLRLTPHINHFLEQLVQNNLFLRRLDETPPVYVFHHLFHDFVQKQALRLLPTPRQRGILARSGHWFLRQNRPEQALHYYLRAQAYGMVEKILERVGLQLMATRRMTVLKEAAEKLSDQVVISYAWLSFFVATVYANRNPVKSKGYLDQAYIKFMAQQDQIGELMVLIALITYHLGVDCNFAQGQKLVSRAEALYNRWLDRLPTAARVQSACGVANGLCQCTGHLQLAIEYSDTVARIARTHTLDDAMAGIYVSRGFTYCYQGNFKALKKEIESALPMLQSPRVSGLNKLCLVTLQFAYLSLSGDFDAFRYYRLILTSLFESTLFTTSAIGAFIGLLNTDCALTEDRREEAMQLALEVSGFSGGQSAHIQSIALAFQARVYALRQQRTKAQTAAETALQLRQEAGNPYYTTAIAITIGAVYIRLGHCVKAHKLLDQAIERSHQMGAMWLCAGAYAQRAHLYLKTAQADNAHADLRHFLRIMKTQGYLNCCGWHPELMQTLLHAAVVQGIEIAYASKLAQKQLKLSITTQGECIPLLEITALGGFELRIKGKPPLDGTAFTKSQRALLALLIGADHSKYRLAGIQEEFWPNSATAKNRTSLANLIARLRQTLEGYLAPYSVDHYVKVEKGYLHLRNCQVDAVDFEQTTAQANRHLERGQFWQADVSQLRAHGLYKGAFLPGVHLLEPSYRYREKLHCDYLTDAEQWSQMLAAAGRFPEAIAVSQKALAHDPTHEPLVKIVYRLFIQNKDRVQAKKTISNYASALQKEGYTEDEIDLALKELSKLKHRGP